MIRHIRKIEMIRHLIDGIKYGFPLCCIAFYMWRNFKSDDWRTAYLVDKERGNMSECTHGYIPLNPDIEYVQCDWCFNTS